MTILERVLCKLFHHIDIEEGGKLYLRRWFIYPRYPQMKKMEPRLYLHKFHSGDNLRDLHDHPWPLPRAWSSRAGTGNTLSTQSGSAGTGCAGRKKR